MVAFGRRNIPMSDIRRMYNSSCHVGGVYLQQAVDKDALQSLRLEIVGLYRIGLFAKSPSQEGVVRQTMSTLYVGDMPTDKGITIEAMPVVAKFADKALNFYNIAAEIANFQQVDSFNSIGLHRYPGRGGGIDFHRDYDSDRGMVIIVSVEGNAKTSIARTRAGDSCTTYITSPGDVILLRANRSAGETPDLRPFHSVETMGSERFSLIFRTKGEKRP